MSLENLNLDWLFNVAPTLSVKFLFENTISIEKQFD